MSLYVAKKTPQSRTKRRDVALCSKREHHKLTGLSASQDGEIIFAASKA